MINIRDLIVNQGFVKAVLGVGGSGGGSLPAGAYLSNPDIYLFSNNRNKRFMYNGEMYVGCGTSTSTGYLKKIAKWNGTGWTTIINDTGTSGIGGVAIDSVDFKIAEFNSKLHIFSDRNHVVFDGSTVTKSTQVPVSGATYPVVYHGELMVYASSSYKLYKWNASNSTWSEVASFAEKPVIAVVIDEELYLADSSSMYKYKDGALTKIGTLNRGSYIHTHTVVDGVLYYVYTGFSTATYLLKYDFATNTSVEIGKFPKVTACWFWMNTNDISFSSPLDSVVADYVVNIVE